MRGLHRRFGRERRRRAALPRGQQLHPHGACDPRHGGLDCAGLDPSRRQPAPRPSGPAVATRNAMRVLHPRLCDESLRAVPEPGATGQDCGPRHGGRTPERQPVPLHRLPRHHRRGLQPGRLPGPGARRSCHAGTDAIHPRTSRRQRLRPAALSAAAFDAARRASASAGGSRLHRCGPVGHQTAPPLCARTRHHRRGRVAQHRNDEGWLAHRSCGHLRGGLCRAGAAVAHPAPLLAPLCRAAGAQCRHPGWQYCQRFADW